MDLAKTLESVWGSSRNMNGGLWAAFLFLFSAVTITVFVVGAFVIFYAAKAFVEIFVLVMTKLGELVQPRVKSRTQVQAGDHRAEENRPIVASESMEAQTDVADQVSQPNQLIVIPTALAERDTHLGVLRVRQIGVNSFNCDVWKKDQTKLSIAVCTADSIESAMDWALNEVSLLNEKGQRKRLRKTKAVSTRKEFIQNRPNQTMPTIVPKTAAPAVEEQLPSSTFDDPGYLASLEDFRPIEEPDMPIETPQTFNSPRVEQHRSASAVVSYTGELIEAVWKEIERPGRAPYKGFCALIADDALAGGENEIRGNDLRRALNTAGAKPGDRITIRQTGETPVPITKDDGKGNSITKTRKKKVFEVIKH